MGTISGALTACKGPDHPLGGACACAGHAPWPRISRSWHAGLPGLVSAPFYSHMPKIDQCDWGRLEDIVLILDQMPVEEEDILLLQAEKQRKGGTFLISARAIAGG